MKKFTLTLFAVMAAVMAWAQQATVTPPVTATIEDYTLTGKNYYNPEDETVYEDLNETVKVAFDGNDVYIQGLCGYLPTAWVKGTRDGSQITFKTGQFYGEFTYGSDSYSVYFCGYDGTICDVVFNYNEEYGIIKTQTWIISNSSTTKLSAYHYLTEVMLLRGAAEPADETVTPPAGITTVPYLFTALRSIYTGEGFQYDNISRNANVAFDNNDVYVQGMCEQLPEAWVKGTLNGEEAVFATGQFFGNYTDADGDWKLYFVGALAGVTDQLYDVEFDYDRQTHNFTATKYVLLNSTKDTYAPFEQYSNVKLERITNSVEDIEAAKEMSATYTDLSGRTISNPQTATGIVIKTVRMSDGTVVSKKIAR